MTSAIKKVDVGVTDTIKSYIEGNLKGGSSLTYTIENDGVGYEKTNLLSNEVADYVDGKIK